MINSFLTCRCCFCHLLQLFQINLLSTITNGFSLIPLWYILHPVCDIKLVQYLRDVTSAPQQSPLFCRTPFYTSRIHSCVYWQVICSKLHWSWICLLRSYFVLLPPQLTAFIQSKSRHKSSSYFHSVTPMKK